MVLGIKAISNIEVLNVLLKALDLANGAMSAEEIPVALTTFMAIRLHRLMKDGYRGKTWKQHWIF